MMESETRTEDLERRIIYLRGRAKIMLKSYFNHAKEIEKLTARLAAIKKTDDTDTS